MIKSVLLAVFALAAVALGVLYAQERSQTQQLASRVKELETQVSHQTAEIKKQTVAAETLAVDKAKLTAKVESTRRRLSDAKDAAAAVAAAPPTAAPSALPADAPADSASGEPAGAKKPGGPFADYVASMMKDPAMKKMLRTTQAMGMRQIYGDLVKQWALSPDDANSFYDMLADNQMATMERVGQDPARNADATKDTEAALKASLGDDMYSQYQAYQKTITDRMALTQFRQQLASDSLPALTPDQSQFLMDTMAEARASQPAGGPLAKAFQGGAAGGMPGAMSESDVDAFVKAQTDANDKVAQRAASMLNPAQLASFKQYQTQSLAMQRMSLEMAAKMIGGGTGGGKGP